MKLLLNVFDDSGNPVKQKWACWGCELEQMNDEQLNFLWNCSGTDFMHANEKVISKDTKMMDANLTCGS